MIFLVNQPATSFFKALTLIVLLTIFFAQCLPTSALSSAAQTLSAIENKLFAHDYPKEDDKTRLDRIENFVFGATNPGSIQERLDNILKTIPISQSSNQTMSNNTATSSKSPPSKPANYSKTSKTTFDYSHYPRVTGLEQQLLGHSYADQNLTERLKRLENKCFGKPSVSTDLNQRVENLEAYAQQHDLYRDYHPANNFITSNNQTPSPNAEPAQQNIAAVVSIMEHQEFGKAHPNLSLQKRVSKLEKRVYHYDNSDKNQSIVTRIDNLWSALNPSVNNPALPKTSKLPANNGTPSGTPSGTQVDEYGNTGSITPFSDPESSNNTTATKTHHSWLHKVGQVAGTVGSVSLKALSGTAYPYNYGMGGYGMGGYGMGGYGMGGYGMGGYGTGGYGMGNYGMGGYGAPIW